MQHVIWVFTVSRSTHLRAVGGILHTLHYAACHLGIHCFLKYPFKSCCWDVIHIALCSMSFGYSLHLRAVGGTLHTLHYAACHLGIHCFQKYPFKILFVGHYTHCIMQHVIWVFTFYRSTHLRAVGGTLHTLHYAACHLGIHCFQKCPFKSCWWDITHIALCSLSFGYSLFPEVPI